MAWEESLFSGCIMAVRSFQTVRKGKKGRSGPVACIVLGDLLRCQGAVVEGERTDITAVIEF